MDYSNSAGSKMFFQAILIHYKTNVKYTVRLGPATGLYTLYSVALIMVSVWRQLGLRLEEKQLGPMLLKQLGYMKVESS